jgi:hypothetical protein
MIQYQPSTIKTCFLPKPTITSITIASNGNNTCLNREELVENTFLNGGSRVNIIMEILKVILGLSKLKPALYNLHMANQTIVKPLGLIKDLKILVHGIPYAMTFSVIQSSVLYSNYSMLLGHPWLKDAKAFHNWCNNIITIQRARTVRTIHVTKKFGAPTKHPEVLVCYNFHFRISDEEEDLMFTIELGLFSIGTIIVLHQFGQINLLS